MSLRWRVVLVVALVAWFGWASAANFFTPEQRKASWWLPDGGMRLGLDLRGGIHMVLGPDLAVAIGHELSAIRASIGDELAKQKVEGVQIEVGAKELTLHVADAASMPAVREALGKFDTIDVKDAGPDALVVSLTPEWARAVRDRAMLQALEVLRRRVDDPQTGIPESVVTRQGESQILVQIPGVSRVPDIFRQTGFLEFKIVKDAAPTEELLKARYPNGLPPDTEIVLEKERETKRVVGAYLVPKEADITGDYLTDARVGFDNRRNEWLVSFTWSPEGGDIFGDLTGAHVKEPLAIILDGVVYSAPTIQQRISRQGQITGRFTSQEAGDLAVVLRAGALPIPVTIEEERTIGPTLGADSIREGMEASLLGIGLVVLFAVVYYRLSGVYASVALLANMVMLIGLMSVFGGTLTLPGIAGIVLTVGMAIDGNVIIFERIREELRAKRTPRAAISAGFEKARWTILDANITTLITAIVLYQYGTGPVKGFAVTLSVGIVTSVFTALVVTRLLYDGFPGHRNVSQLSI